MEINTGLASRLSGKALLAVYLREPTKPCPNGIGKLSSMFFA